jgi:transcriptional regulator with XRE-family HTH domain
MAIQSGTMITDGGELRRLRLQQGLTVRELATRSKVSERTIARIESGEAPGGKRTLTLLGNALHTAPAAPRNGTGHLTGDLSALPDAVLWAEVTRLLAETQRRYWAALAHTQPEPAERPDPAGQPPAGELGELPPEAWEPDEGGGQTHS